MNKNVVAWVAKKTPNVALSSTEAEYVTMAEATRMNTYIMKKIECLELKIKKPCMIGTDSQGAMNLANMNATTCQSKHIDIWHHYIQEQCELNKIKIFDVDVR